jgi:hypothetical protein
VTPDMYTSLRITKRTREQLAAYKANLRVQIVRNPSRFPEYVCDNPLSDNAVLLYLLEQQRRHTARAGAAKLAKGKRDS